MSKFLIVPLLIVFLAASACTDTSGIPQLASGKPAGAVNQESASPEADLKTPEADPAKTELFVKIEDAHGIVFDDNGSMFVGKATKEILKVNPEGVLSSFITISDIPDSTDKTRIWNMTIGADGFIYAAAGDRILKISPEGKAENYIMDDYKGEWGACDLKFDRDGNLYVVHGSNVERYSGELVKSTLIDGVNGGTKLKAAVGLCFTADFKDLLVSDVFGNKVVKFSINKDGTAGTAELYESVRSAEYITVDGNGNIYVSQPGEWVLGKISPDGSLTSLSGDNLFREPTTLAFGGKGFDENAIYVVSKGNIYRMPVGTGGG